MSSNVLQAPSFDVSRTPVGPTHLLYKGSAGAKAGKAGAPRDKLLHRGSHTAHKPKVEDRSRAHEGLGDQEGPSVMEESFKAPPRPCWRCAERPGLLCLTGVGLLEPRTRWLICVFKGSIFQAAGVTSAP